MILPQDTSNKKHELAVEGHSLAVNIAAGASVELDIIVVYAHQLLPFPEEFDDRVEISSCD